MSEQPTKPWTMKPCFVGEDCWCAIIVDPDGEECNSYGDITRGDGRYIIDALNRTPGAEGNVNERHPAPWFVETNKHGHPYIVTKDGLGNDDLEHCVSVHRGIHTTGLARLFVEAVNSFYGKDEA